MDEKIVLERDMNVELRFVDKYRSLILSFSFSIPVLWIFLYPVFGTACWSDALGIGYNVITNV